MRANLRSCGVHIDSFGVPRYESHFGRHENGGYTTTELLNSGESVRTQSKTSSYFAPRHLPALLAAARTATDLPLIAYPNGGERWDAANRRWLADEGGTYDPATVASWTALGATWLGGCCGTGPADIAALAARLRAA